MHLIDVNVAMGDLVALAQSEGKAYRSSPARTRGHDVVTARTGLRRSTAWSHDRSAR